jgi:hypothetical protein
MTKDKTTKIKQLLAKEGKNVSLRDLENVLGLVGLVGYERLCQS